jgi:hypothetical protein
MKLFDFFGKALSDNGQPSSKRLAAFMVLIFVFIMEGFKLFGDLAGFTYDTMVTFLFFSAASLGLTTFEKFASEKQMKKANE